MFLYDDGKFLRREVVYINDWKHLVSGAYGEFLQAPTLESGRENKRFFLRTKEIIFWMGVVPIANFAVDVRRI